MGEVIDIHTHPAFFEPICGTEGLLEQRRQALGLYKTGTARLEHIHNQMQCAGIDRLALLPLDLSTQENQVIVSNEEIRLLVELDPLRFIGFASVDPYRPDALDALEHAFGDLKLAGLKLHPARQNFSPASELLDPIYALCLRYNKPILFHSGLSLEPNTTMRYANPLEFEPVAARYPKTAHLSGAFWISVGAGNRCTFVEIPKYVRGHRLIVF